MNNQYDIVRFESLSHGGNKKFPIDDWDVKTAIRLVDINDYKYFWFETIDSKIIEEPKKYTVKSNIVKRSGTHFINGFIETREDVAIRAPELVRNMDKTGCDKIVSGINHEWSYLFSDNDKLIDTNGNVV